MDYQFKGYSDWHGCVRVEFTLNGRYSIVVRPKNPLPGNPTVWRAEFFSAFDMVDRALLESGWHLCYHKVSDMYGCPESLEMMHEFQEFVTQTFGLAKKPVLFGFSRGGLYSVNYAAKYPECVAGLYLDAPVCDIRYWPCGYKGTREAEECKRWYGLTEETLADFKGNPLDKLEALKAADLPVMLVAGAVDTVVPYDTNGKLFAERYAAMGGRIEVIVKPDCDHHPHSLEDPAPVVAFIEKNMM